MVEILILSGIILLYFMKSKYNYEFHQQKLGIIIFLITETSALIVFTVVSIIDLINSRNKIEDKTWGKEIYEYNGLRSTI
jgi:hypothetical protein